MSEKGRGSEPNGTGISGLLGTRRVIIAVGAGGVGKTTTAAALGVAAAKKGKRVLCLTIDPARRLAESLGVDPHAVDAVPIEAERFQRASIAISGSLSVMMLDTKRTFDELVLRYSSSAEKAERLLKNQLYQYVSTSLAGTQEYMAIERLIAVKDDPSYDLIILDTPPTTNALDFLDAPDRLIDALDSAAMRWFVEAFQTTGRLSLNLLARSAALVLRTMGRITGGDFLENMARFITELNDLFGGFRQRAKLVHQALRAPDVAFVVVTSASPMSITEALYFSERLQENGMPRGAFVLNRFRAPPKHAGEITTGQIESHLQSLNLSLGQDGPARVKRAHEDAVKLAALDLRNIRVLEEWNTTEKLPIVRVPELSTDVHDLKLLSLVGDILTGGEY